MSETERALSARFPNIRRFFDTGFQHNPKRDAPKFGMVCLENAVQTLFVEPETGYFRVGRNSLAPQRNFKP